MDIIAGIITVVFLLFLFLISDKIKIPKKLNTSLLSGFIVYIILTKRIAPVGQKIGIIAVSLLLIFATNLKVQGQEKEHLKSQVKDKTKK